ncbi:hypothetical protein JCM17960_09870 [Magnetospira thiophila]
MKHHAGASGLRTLLGLLLLLVGLLTSPPARAAEISIGVLAKGGIEATLQQWQPTADYLNRVLPEHRFRVVPVLFDEVSMVVRNKLVDFVIMNSAIYVKLSVRFGVQRLLTLKNRAASGQPVSRFGSLIFTSRQHPEITNLRDLAHRRVVGVHPSSLGGWIMALRELKEVGIGADDFADLKYLETHEAVVEAVADGRAEVGIVRTDTLERMAAQGRLDLADFRVVGKRSHADFPFLSSSRLYPEWPIAKLSHVSRDLAKEVALALMAMEPTDEAAQRSLIAGWTIPENYQPVHEILQELKLEPYEWFGLISPAAAFWAYWPWLLLVAAVLLLQTFMVIRILGLNRTLRSHQEALQRTEQQYRSTFDQAPVGIAHISPEGDMLRVNQAFSALTGFSASELNGLNYNHLPHAEELAAAIAQLNDLKDGLKAQLDLHQRWVTKTQDVIHVRVSASTARDDYANIRFIILVAMPTQDRGRSAT